MSKRRVMGFGTFDAVHPGHLFYLKKLRELGEELVVVVARDKNVEAIKPSAPHFDEEKRRQDVEDAGIADWVILGDLKDFYRPIREFKPDVIGLGYDQRTDEKALKKAFPDIEIHRLEAFKPEKYKSSIIKAKGPSSYPTK
jgi:FAD synthetase